MFAAWSTMAEWLVRSAAGGTLILLIVVMLMRRSAQPVKQQRLAEWGLAAALVLAALCWLPPIAAWPIHQAAPEARSAVTSADHAGSELAKGSGPIPEQSLSDAPSQPIAADSQAEPNSGESAFTASPEPLTGTYEEPNSQLNATINSNGVASPGAGPVAASPKGPPQTTETTSASWVWPYWQDALKWLAIAYATGALFVLGRWLLGHITLTRLLQQAEFAPASVLALLRDLTPGANSTIRLLISDSISIPLSCGIWRPTILLPRRLVKTGSEKVLRWALAHELAHLERRDAWSCFLFNLRQVVYYYLPWFWRLRRQVWLCQEFIADASAAEAEARADYAQFLLGMTRAPGLPAGATGVSGYSSDLYRRITMLLRCPTSLDRRVSRLWSLAAGGGLLSLAVLLAGVGLRVDAAPTAGGQEAKQDEPKKDDTKKEEPKKDEAKKDNAASAPAIADIQKRLREVQLEREKALRQLQAEMEKLQADLRKNAGNLAPGGFGGNGGFVRFNADLAADHAFPGYHPQEGRLGVHVQKPSATLAEQLDLPKGQGLVIEQVTPDSAAAKAGLKPHDILLEIAGKTVPDNTAELSSKILSEIKADTKVDAVVLRKGKKETIKGLSLPEAKAQQPGRAFGGPGFPGGVPLDVPNIGFPGAPGGFAPGLPGAGGVGGAGVPPGFPGGGRGNGAGFKGIMTTSIRTDDRFTTRHQEGSLVITVTGKVTDGKAKTSEIQVQDGNTTNKYESVDKVPEQYRDKVKNLIEMSERGSVKVETKER
ncbi:MAG: M56 family metallopeptidase [Gemmataceae bacterium]